MKAFLELSAAHTKTILLTTAGDEERDAGAAGVVASTAGSRPAGVKRTTETVRARIHAIIDAAS